MKKILLMSVVLLAGIIFLPSKTFAQYTIAAPYNITNYSIAAAGARGRSARISANRRRAAAHRRAAHRRAVRRKALRRRARRVSMLENSFAPKIKINAGLQRRSEIV